MGVIGRGILGGFSGKVANVVGGSWKGIAYMRSLPLSVANPKTAGQVLQRGKMAGVVIFAKLILADIIKPLNDRFAQKQSGYNLFVSRNIGDVSSAGVPTMADIILSEGNLDGFDGLSQSYVPGTKTVTVEWNDNSGTGLALATDKLYAVCYNQDEDEITVSSAVATRNDESVDIVLPTLTALDVVQTACSFLREDGSVVSTSAFVQSTT